MRPSPFRLVGAVSLVFCLAALLIFAYLTRLYLMDDDTRRAEARRSAQVQAGAATAEVDEALRSLMGVAHDLAARLGKRGLSEHEMQAVLREPFETHPGVFGVGVAYAPYAWRPDVRLYSPYYIKEDERLKHLQVEEAYDYTAPDRGKEGGPRTAWYHRPLAEGAMWQEPYYGTASETMLAEYGVPFSYATGENAKKNPGGVVFVNYSLQRLRALVDSLDLGSTGFGFVFSESGTVIAYPIAEYLGEHVAALRGENELLSRLAEHAGDGAERLVTDVRSGQTYWVFYKAIPSTGWVMGVVFVEDEILGRTRGLHRIQIGMGLSFAGFLFFLCVLVLPAEQGRPRNLWWVSAVFSILCMASIGFVWYLATISDLGQQNIVTANKEGIASALNRLDRSLGKAWYESVGGARVQIPTGVFVQSLKFSGPYEVTMTGYVWQRHTPDIPQEITPGFILPEAEEVSIEQAYQSREVTGWYFEAVLRQPFDYSHYPFDREDVWLRLWPADLKQNVVLVPDFQAYEFTDARLGPGLEKDFVVEGWRVVESFFSYRVNRYNTDFGIDQAERNRIQLELYFNVGLKRDFLSAFVSHMIALIVVTFLLFAVLVTSTKEERQIELFGFNAASTLQYTSALFFVLIVSHIFLRNATAAVGVVYLEYFYFVMYIAILAVSVNAILVSSRFPMKLVDYHDNFLAKLLFWPAVLLPLLVITVYVFY